MINDLGWYLAGFLTPLLICLGFLIGSGTLAPLLRLGILRAREARHPAAADPLDMGMIPSSHDMIDLSQYTPDGPTTS